MSTISVRIDEEIKNKFSDAMDKSGIDSSTAIRLFINKAIENPSIVKLDLDYGLLSDEMTIWEKSFSEVWDNNEDDIYSKLYNNA